MAEERDVTGLEPSKLIIGPKMPQIIFHAWSLPRDYAIDPPHHRTEQFNHRCSRDSLEYEVAVSPDYQGKLYAEIPVVQSTSSNSSMARRFLTTISFQFYIHPLLPGPQKGESYRRPCWNFSNLCSLVGFCPKRQL